MKYHRHKFRLSKQTIAFLVRATSVSSCKMFMVSVRDLVFSEPLGFQQHFCCRALRTALYDPINAEHIQCE